MEGAGAHFELRLDCRIQYGGPRSTPPLTVGLLDVG